MAGEASRALFTGEEVLHLLECYEDELDDADLDEIFPGSDDELGFMEEEVETDGEKYIKLLQTMLLYLMGTYIPHNIAKSMTEMMCVETMYVEMMIPIQATDSLRFSVTIPISHRAHHIV